MVFNVAAHNRDDHAKNFAFIMSQAGEWSLSPAYDLGFAQGSGGEHTMTILGQGRAPGRSGILKLAKQFDIKLNDATTIIEEVNTAVGRWNHFAQEAGCTKKTGRAIGARLTSI